MRRIPVIAIYVLVVCLTLPWTFASAEDASPMAVGLPGLAAADTVRTNLWLTEALMAEIVASTAKQLPPPPAAVRLLQEANSDADVIFMAVAARVLSGLGYELYVPEDDPAQQGAVEYEFAFTVVMVDLSYPDVGRSLGLWRQWVERDMSVTAQVGITEVGSGRLLLNDLVERRFLDRVPSDDFDDVNSDLYPFTIAETKDSGWRGRIEAIVVLGTLAGLVAVYFANTSD